MAPTRKTLPTLAGASGSKKTGNSKASEGNSASNVDLTAILNLLQTAQEGRQELTAYGINEGENSQLPDDGAEAMDADEQTDSDRKALEVLKLFVDLKGNNSADGELIYDKNGDKVWYQQFGTNNHRYTINRELSVDVNAYNEEVYFHIKRKNPKKNVEAVSIRYKLFPVFDFIYGHAAPKLQNNILGKNIDPNMALLALKLLK